MEVRRRKRQKKLVTTSSDEEESDDGKENGPRKNLKYRHRESEHRNASAFRALPTRARTRASNTSPNAKTVQVSGAQEISKKVPGRKNTSSKNLPTKGSKPISIFFPSSSITDERREISSRLPEQRLGAKTGQPPTKHEEDLIEDDDPIEQPETLSTVTANDYGSRKSLEDEQISNKRIGGASRSFKLNTNDPNVESLSTSKPFETIDSRPWSERHRPCSVEDLAVNKKKVTDVKNWLTGVFSGTVRQRLLILKGPSGAGKSTTLGVLAASMKIDVVEWKDPIGLDFSSEAYTSMSAQFEDFLSRGRRFGGLDFENEGHPTPIGNAGNNSKDNASQRSIIVVEDFPANLQSASPALLSFRASIMEYLASNTTSSSNLGFSHQGLTKPVNPLVLSITETSLSPRNVDADSFTARKLLGAEILDHSLTSVIEFNPVAASFVMKAMEHILQKEARRSYRRAKLSSSLLKRLGEAGDVRSAINALELLYLRVDKADGGRSQEASFNGSSQGVPNQPGHVDERVEAVTQRELTLGLFHAVGKVLYNKRDKAQSIASRSEYDVLPSEQLAKHGLSQVSVDQLVEETGTDAGTFIATLHENFVPSCAGSTFSESLNGCLDAISDSDILDSYQKRRSGMAGSSNRAFHSSGIEVVRHGEISFHLAVRGMLFTLPNPVKRSAHPSGTSNGKGSKYNAFKMYFPLSLRLFRQTEEVEALIRQWMYRHEQVSTPSEAQPSRSQLLHTMQELAFERLPYQRMIMPRDNGRLSQDLDKITQLDRLSRQDVGLGEEDDLDGAEIAVDPSTSQSVPSRGIMVSRPCRKDGKNETIEDSTTKLYLSDDDIEDD